MTRNWAAARAKIDGERRCRVAGSATTCHGPLETAHVIGRRYDDRNGQVRPVDVIPLCRRHHRDYDLGRLDVLPVLTLEEQAAAVGLVGLLRAWRRVTGSSKGDTPSEG